MAVYLDFNATTPVDDAVYNAICNTLKKCWGNPSSSYLYGKEALEIIQEARVKVAAMIGCFSNEIIFTSGGTESNNMVIHSAIEHFNSNFDSKNVTNPVAQKPHIITTNIEHDSVRLPLEALSTAGKIDVSFVPVSKNSGAVNVEDIMDAVRPNTCLITVMLANNETGVIQPVKLISSGLKKLNIPTASKILIHTDAAQALGKIDVDINDLKVDYLTIVGHKFYGPRIGALYFEKSKPLHPLLYGGGQERSYRPGTENTCMIAGLGKAAELVSLNIDKYRQHMMIIRNYLEDSLRKEFPEKVIFNVNANVDKLPNSVSVAFNYNDLTGPSLLREASDIFASTGAACHSDNKVSSVLIASGVSVSLASKTLRLSVGRETSKQDINRAIQSLKNAVEKLCPS